MLQIREPISTVLRPDFLHGNEGFHNRITGNYSQIGAFVDEADLLHLFTEPPEIFVMNGGMTSLFSQANVENNQIQKVNIVNNLINRIMVSADGNLSYQDNVYITNILHKLGIRDERKFMKEVYRLTQETKEQNEAINLYWDNMTQLQQMVEEYRDETRTEIRNEESVLNRNVLHLHEEVNRRLDTAVIYRVMQNFYENTGAPYAVTNEEYRITEQTRLSSEVLLNMLRETARGEAQPLIYRKENIYEGDEGDVENVTYSEINERITSAVLLNLIDNLYETTYDRLDHKVENWISAEDTFYGAAENTLYRIEQNTAYLQYLHEEAKKIENAGDMYRTEINYVNALLDIYRSQDFRIQQSIGGNSYQNEYNEERVEGDSFFTSHTETTEPAEMTFVTNEGDRIEETEVSGEQKTELEERLYQTYQQNIARHNHYMQNLKNVLERYTEEPSSESPEERTRRETRMALEHPEQFRAEFDRSEEEAAERTREIRTELEKALPPEQQMAHQIIREYLRAPERFSHTETVSRDNLGLLLLDIKEAEEEGKGVTPEAGRENASLPERGEEGKASESPVYPPSTDTTVRNAYPAVTGVFTPDSEASYNETVLQNIYPVYSTELVYRNFDTTVENIAETIREASEERAKESLPDEVTKQDLPSIIREREIRMERTFQAFAAGEALPVQENMVFRRETEIVNDMTDRVIFRWLERQATAAEPVNRQFDETVSVVHRNRETTVSEDTIEELREELKKVEETNRQTTQRVENITQEQHTVINTTTNEVVENQQEQITSIVSKSVRSQLDEITDKVYGRIERQLRNEQRRRGL